MRFFRKRNKNSQNTKPVVSLPKKGVDKPFQQQLDSDFYMDTSERLSVCECCAEEGHHAVALSRTT